MSPNSSPVTRPKTAIAAERGHSCRPALSSLHPMRGRLSAVDPDGRVVRLAALGARADECPRPHEDHGVVCVARCRCAVKERRRRSGIKAVFTFRVGRTLRALKCEHYLSSSVPASIEGAQASPIPVPRHHTPLRLRRHARVLASSWPMITMTANLLVPPAAFRWQQHAARVALKTCSSSRPCWRTAARTHDEALLTARAALARVGELLGGRAQWGPWCVATCRAPACVGARRVDEQRWGDRCHARPACLPARSKASRASKHVGMEGGGVRRILFPARPEQCWCARL